MVSVMRVTESHKKDRLPNKCGTLHSMTRPTSFPDLGVFDLDGTLVELEIEHFIDHAMQVTKNLGCIVPSRAHIRHLMRNHRIEELFPVELRDEGIRKYWHSYDARQIPAPRLIDGALATLEEMVACGCDLAIATARTVHEDELREVLRPTGILNHVEFLSTWWQTGWTGKVEQLRRICHQHKVEPVRALMVGDSRDDMKSAEESGFGLRIALRGGLHHDDVLAATNPNYIVDGIIEVPRVVRAHCGISTQS